MADVETLYVEVPADMKRALEQLVLHYRRRRQPNEPRNLSEVVRLACQQLLARDLPGYKEDTTGA